MAARAELLADGGEAASSSDSFFRSPQFLEAESVTHTLRIETDDDEQLVAPLIVREIPGGAGLDATSPYGYPGLARSCPRIPGTTSSGSLDPAEVDFSETGLVAAFIRHTLDDPPALAGARDRNVVQIADPALPPKSRGSDRNQINKNVRNGYAVRLVRGPEASDAERAGFLAAYEETMRRADASARYFFGAAYFDRILEAEGTWLAIADSPDGAVAAASIAAPGDGYLHYYLSGTADAHLRDSPMKNVVAALVELSGELSLPLNLGGGITPGDRLEEFKRGFANREAQWRTSELVCDPQAYGRLSAGRESGDFFPAYRAGS